MTKQSMKPALKLALTGFSISALLAVSACSGDNPAPDTESATIETPAEADEVIEPITEAMETAEAEGDTVAAEPEVLLASDAGATLYELNCRACHENGLLNAPKYGDAMAWSTLLAKDRATLYLHSAQGFNKMPAQAVNGVTEAEVKAAVDYMLEAVS